MRHLDLFALVLACLLTLTACGGETAEGTVDPENPPPYPPFTSKNATLQCVDGLYIALPMEYSGLLYLDSAFPDAGESWKPLISVFEKNSYEAAMEDFGGGGGFLFGLLVMDQAAFEQHISAGSPGIEVFATDGERYYAYTFPTDVQFYRPGLSGSNLLDHPDWETWERLCEIGPLVREDFLTRNNLQSFDVQDFLNQQADGEDYLCVRYYPYFVQDGDTHDYYQLLLRQPATQGEGGLWAVEQWLDEYGTPSLYFPDSGKPAAEYYAELQEQCNVGEHPELLTPLGAADAFVKEYFGHKTYDISFETAREINQDYMEQNQRLQEMVSAVMFDKDIDQRELLECAGNASADNWGVLDRNLYGSDWFVPLMEALAEAAVGEDQQWRDTMVYQCLLSTWHSKKDFHTPLETILQTQKEVDPDAFAAATAPKEPGRSPDRH